MDVTYLRKRKDRNYGASAGFKLWTGETEGLPTSIDKQFPINGQYGSEYSHGILYIAFILETAQCTVGYDAEGISLNYS